MGRPPAALVAVLLAGLASGCGPDPGYGEVSGAVTIDGRPAPLGASVTFVPADGQAATAGAVIENGRYATRVPVGVVKVQIRAPRPGGRAKSVARTGSYQPAGEWVEELLPARYHDRTELTLDVRPGRQQWDWHLRTTR